MDLKSRPAGDDPVHAALRKAEERKITSYLWVPGDTKPFIPRVLPLIYGDGRALFNIATINQRPAFWVIRACSTWGSAYDHGESSGPDFAEITDEILTDLEATFGNGRCGYSGNSLFWPRRDRLEDCQCEECDEKGYVAKWPMVDGYGGCSWSRRDWPDGFETVANPLSWCGNLLKVEPTFPEGG